MFNTYFGHKAYSNFDFVMWVGDKSGLFDRDLMNFLYGEGQ